ncbi:MAG: hypothetical protein IKN36_02300, partial [Clostridia bacterium]|nr:hypothetical protein [Clostridia bacterium]
MTGKPYAKPRRSFGSIMLRIVIVAVILLAAAAAVLYFVGIRYVSSTAGSGLTVKFFGIVDKEGAPARGVIRYSNGMTAKYDASTGRLEYSNGDVYEGTLKDMLKNGEGLHIFTCRQCHQH